MKILHTSDWHLGSSLCGHKRYEESEDFLIWLDELIRKEQIDAVLVSGDIFEHRHGPATGRRSCITSSSTGSRQYRAFRQL